MKRIFISEKQTECLLNDKPPFEQDKFGIASEGDSSTYCHVTKPPISENLEAEIDAKDVDLSSFQLEDTLASGIWEEDGVLNPKVRMGLLDIADDFFATLSVSWIKPIDIVLMGSICNFNWSKYSDIDVHIIVDFSKISENIEFVQEYFDSKKNLWNESHENLEMFGFHVELYVEDVNAETESSGVYSLEKNEWIKEPTRGDIGELTDEDAIKEHAADIMTYVDELETALDTTNDKHEIEKIGDTISDLMDMLRKNRKSGLESSGEMNPRNILYKVLRRTEYLDKMRTMKDQCYDIVNSINESKIRLNEYLDKNYNMPLVQYFKWARYASGAEKVSDLISHCPWVIKDFMHMYYLEPWYEEKFSKYLDCDFIEDYADEIANVLEDLGLINDCYNYFDNHVEYYDLPSWMFVDYIREVKNEWCIHFCKDSESVAREGFTGGTDDLSNLAYTNAGAQKPYEGYDFAYLIDDKNVDRAIYGCEAVIFRTSGVLIYHHGDNENQVIFWGRYAHDFIPIKRDDYSDEWVALDSNFNVMRHADKPSDVVYWAINNLPQYRKRIMRGKNGGVEQTFAYNYDKKVPKWWYNMKKRQQVHESVINADEVYEKIQTNQVFRYRVINGLASNGYIFHGGDDDFTEFDKSQIKGGSRGIYGYGAYFTDAAYKCEEYGDHFMVVNKHNYNFLNLKLKVNDDNIFTNIFTYIAKLENMVENSRNVSDYEKYSYELEKYNEIVRNPLFVKAKDICDKNTNITFRELNNTVGGYSDVSVELSEMYLQLGYDGFIYDNQYVIFNFYKLNKELSTIDKKQIFLQYVQDNALNELNIKGRLNEEIVADGNASHNVYAKRWKQERETLKKYLINNGTLMSSKENGKTYKVLVLQDLSNLVGITYCACLEYDMNTLESGSTVYLRALDKFTSRIFTATMDKSGFDNDSTTKF